jgi:hypothetical protein
VKRRSVRVAPPLWLGLLLLLCALAAAGAAAGAPGDPADLTLTLSMVGGGVTREVGAEVFLEVTVVNHGNGSAVPFVVDVWASKGTWGHHSLPFPGLAPGANISVETTVPYVSIDRGPVIFSGLADPAGAVDDAHIDDNSAQKVVQFVSYKTIPVGNKLASSTPLEDGDCLVFEIDLREGESILFRVDTREGSARIDQYLLDEPNWWRFQDALREGSAVVTYFQDFSSPNTSHVAFSTPALPAGRYYVILDNAAILEHGADPAGEATVTYSIARVGSGVPLELVLLIAVVGAGAVVATLRWRPSFESSEAVLSVPTPELGALGPEDEPDGDDAAEGMETEDDGATGGAKVPSQRPPRPPRN